MFARRQKLTAQRRGVSDMSDSIHAKALRILAENADNGTPLGDEHGIESQALRNAAEYIDELEAELTAQRRGR
jgi:hypothetical protein